ncbi:hypothetical protein ACTA71_000570 [Dictyostelium dimigraforme]
MARQRNKYVHECEHLRCNKSFICKRDLVNHLKIPHNCNRPGSPDTLEMEEKCSLSHTKKATNFFCNICNLYFSTNQKLKQHNKNFHTEEKEQEKQETKNDFKGAQSILNSLLNDDSQKTISKGTISEEDYLLHHQWCIVDVEFPPEVFINDKKKECLVKEAYKKKIQKDHEDNNLKNLTSNSIYDNTLARLKENCKYYEYTKVSCGFVLKNENMALYNITIENGSIKCDCKAFTMNRIYHHKYCKHILHILNKHLNIEGEDLKKHWVNKTIPLEVKENKEDKEENKEEEKKENKNEDVIKKPELEIIEIEDYKHENYIKQLNSDWNLNQKILDSSTEWILFHCKKSVLNRNRYCLEECDSVSNSIGKTIIFVQNYLIMYRKILDGRLKTLKLKQTLFGEIDK